MNGSDETLAEHLGIELPGSAKPEKVEVKVYTENLKEVKVSFNDASLINEEKLTDTDNYRILGNKIEKATLVGNDVVLRLSKDLIKGTKHDLIIRNLDKEINKKHRFEAKDDVAPRVEKVEVLGEYGIKVTTSEPIARVEERNFLVDGKNIAMELETYGRELILTPYYDKEFPADAKEIEIKGLVDYAGFKSSVVTEEIEVVKDEVAPKVEKIEVVADNVIDVTFDKDVYAKSVKAYESRRQLGNVSYGEGRHTIYSKADEKAAQKLDTNKVRYVFEEKLPRNVDITVEGVTNHSKVEMEKVTERAVVKLDYTEPMIIDVVEHQISSTEMDLYIYFDKDVRGVHEVDSNKKELETFDAAKHFDLYTGSVASRNLVRDYGITAKYGAENNIIVVSLSNLKLNNKANNFEYDYVLEVKNFEDETTLHNRMYVDYHDFELREGREKFELLRVDVEKNVNKIETEIRLTFNRAIDRELAETKSNYLFKTDNNNVRRDVADLRGRIITERNGKVVTIVLPGADAVKNFDKLEVLDTLKAVDGQRLEMRQVYDFKTGFIEGQEDALKTELEKLITYAGSVKEKVVNPEDGEKLEAAINEAKTKQNATTSGELEKAIADLNKELAKDKYKEAKKEVEKENSNNKKIKELKETLESSEVKNELGNMSDELVKKEYKSEDDFLKEAEKAVKEKYNNKKIEDIAKSNGEDFKVEDLDVNVVASFDESSILVYEFKVASEEKAIKVRTTVMKSDVELEELAVESVTAVKDTQNVEVTLNRKFVDGDKAVTVVINTDGRDETYTIVGEAKDNDKLTFNISADVTNDTATEIEFEVEAKIGDKATGEKATIKVAANAEAVNAKQEFKEAVARVTGLGEDVTVGEDTKFKVDEQEYTISDAVDADNHVTTIEKAKNLQEAVNAKLDKDALGTKAEYEALTEAITKAIEGLLTA